MKAVLPVIPGGSPTMHSNVVCRFSLELGPREAIGAGARKHESGP